MEQIRFEISATHDRPESEHLKQRRAYLMQAHQHLIDTQYALDLAVRGLTMEVQS
jgi:hypothetical protein